MGLVCLSSWAYYCFKSLLGHVVRSQRNWVTVGIPLAAMAKLILVVSCFCCPSVASQGEDTQATTGDYDRWYLVGCVITLVLAWEGLKTPIPRSPGASASASTADAAVQTSRDRTGIRGIPDRKRRRPAVRRAPACTRTTGANYLCFTRCHWKEKP